MNNLSKFLVGVSLAVVMVGGSAFKMAENAKAARAAGDMYGSRDEDNPYQHLSQPYDPDLCEAGAAKRCFYQVTEAGASTVTGSSYTEAQLETWANQTIPFVTRSSTSGIYAGD